MLRSISAWSLFSLTGCGNALVGADYYGQPLFAFSGEVDLADQDSGDQELDDVRMALLWSQKDGVTDALQQDLVISTAFPAQYEMVLYHPPPDEAFTIPRGEGSIDNAFAYGLPLAYVDADGSKSFEEGEEILGITVEAFIFYLPEGFATFDPPEGVILLEDVFAEGYHVVAFDGRACQDDRPAPPRPADSDDVDVLISDDLTSILQDTDCDGTLDEWALLCGGECPAP